MTKTLKPGNKASRSGEYEILGPRGGKERTAGGSKALAPLRAGETLVTKSGRTIIVSPARSTHTSVDTWSKAFKK